MNPRFYPADVAAAIAAGYTTRTDSETGEADLYKGDKRIRQCRSTNEAFDAMVEHHQFGAC